MNPHDGYGWLSLAVLVVAFATYVVCRLLSRKYPDGLPWPEEKDDGQR